MSLAGLMTKVNALVRDKASLKLPVMPPQDAWPKYETVSQWTSWSSSDGAEWSKAAARD
jgi:hypothetical protein